MYLFEIVSRFYLYMKDRLGELERGSEWEVIKILLEGDENYNKMNTASKTCLLLNYPSWPRPRNHWSATGPRKPITTYTYSRTQRNKQLEHH
jgi:hypothetical protein